MIHRHGFSFWNYSSIERSGKILAAHLEAFKNLPGIANVRSLGMIAAFDLTDKDGASGSVRARNLCRTALNKAILIRPLRPAAYLMLPLIVDDEEVLAGTTLFIIIQKKHFLTVRDIRSLGQNSRSF